MGWPSTTVSVLAYDLAAVVSICLRLRLAQTREMLRGKVKNRGNSLGRGALWLNLEDFVVLDADLSVFFFYSFSFSFSFPFPLSCPLFLFSDVDWQGLQAGGKDGTVMGLRLHLLPSDCEDSLRHFFFVLSFVLSFLRISQPPFFSFFFFRRSTVAAIPACCDYNLFCNAVDFSRSGLTRLGFFPFLFWFQLVLNSFPFLLLLH